jgi:hypothetical protein
LLCEAAKQQSNEAAKQQSSKADRKESSVYDFDIIYKSHHQFFILLL